MRRWCSFIHYNNVLLVYTPLPLAIGNLLTILQLDRSFGKHGTGDTGQLSTMSIVQLYECVKHLNHAASKRICKLIAHEYHGL